MRGWVLLGVLMLWGAARAFAAPVAQPLTLIPGWTNVAISVQPPADTRFSDLAAMLEAEGITVQAIARYQAAGWTVYLPGLPYSDDIVEAHQALFVHSSGGYLQLVGEPAFVSVSSPTPTATPTPSLSSGDLFATSAVVGKLRFVANGTFLQGDSPSEPCPGGSDTTPFTHTLTKGIAVMETEVTQGMWAALRGVQPSLAADPSSQDAGFAGPDLPVQRIVWSEAILFANLLSQQEGLDPVYYASYDPTLVVSSVDYVNQSSPVVDSNANGYRLPTEGEWEYFARAGTTGSFSSSVSGYSSQNCSTCPTSVLPDLYLFAWVCGNSSATTHQVGQLSANPWSLYDVHGNVAEWCFDNPGSYPVGSAVDFQGAATFSGQKSVRSGLFYQGASSSRSAQRYSVSRTQRDQGIGFRLVRGL